MPREQHGATSSLHASVLRWWAASLLTSVTAGIAWAALSGFRWDPADPVIFQIAGLAALYALMFGPHFGIAAVLLYAAQRLLPPQVHDAPWVARQWANVLAGAALGALAAAWSGERAITVIAAVSGAAGALVQYRNCARKISPGSGWR